ncbi:MAG: hypothetical protein WC974_08520 [Thermoplasmata archaeon]
MKIKFGEKYNKYVDYRAKTPRKQLREIKLIAEIVLMTIRNDNKKLSNNDIKQLCIKIYHKYDKIHHIRVRNMSNSPEIKKQVNDSLLAYYIKKGIKPLEKVDELINKGESAAKSTSDYVTLANHYKDVLKSAPNNTQITQKETIDYAAIVEEGKEDPTLVEQKRTVTRTVTQAISPNSANNSPIEPDLSNNDKTETP